MGAGGRTLAAFTQREREAAPVKLDRYLTLPLA
jgi:hypothetical protein